MEFGKYYYDYYYAALPLGCRPMRAGGSDEAKPVAQTTGNNAFSLLRLDAMQQSWNKVTAREAKLEADSPARLEDSSGFAMCAKPSQS